MAGVGCCLRMWEQWRPWVDLAPSLVQSLKAGRTWLGADRGERPTVSSPLLHTGENSVVESKMCYNCGVNLGLGWAGEA